MPPIPDQTFEQLIAEALDALPERYAKNLNNVVITYEDEPNAEQRQKLALRCNETLFGLYEGIPLTQRGMGYNLVLPDKITLFKLPLVQASVNLEQLQAQIKHTLWHEVGHYFGLDHGRIGELEKGKRSL